jgi:hypothetical protein
MYTTPVASTTLLIQDPFTEPNRDRVATIAGVAPQEDNILYIQFVGETGKGGYLNDMQIVAHAGPPAGDFDGDLDVDGADLVKWKADFGKTQAGLMADGDNDGDADGADFLVWQRQLGTPAPSAAAAGAVPEPAGFVAALIGLLALSQARRHDD